MTYAHQIVRWTMSGDCYNQAEMWTTGFFSGFDDAGVPDTPVPQNVVDSVADKWEAFFEHVQTGISNTYRTVSIKAAIVGTDTHTIGDPVYHFYPAPILGGGGGAVMPAQITLAATLQSGYRNGPAAKGRMYLPGVQRSVESDGRLGVNYQTEICTQFKNFIDGVNTELESFTRVILAGQGPLIQLPGHESRNAYVTDVKIGNVYDTQRRRRNQLNETYIQQGIAG